MGLSQTWPAQVVGEEADPLYVAWQAARRARAVEWSATSGECWRQAFLAECVVIREAFREHIAQETQARDGATAGIEPHAELVEAAQRIIRDIGLCHSRDIAAVVELVERATMLEMKLAQHQNRLRQLPEHPSPCAAQRSLLRSAWQAAGSAAISARSVTSPLVPFVARPLPITLGRALRVVDIELQFPLLARCNSSRAAVDSCVWTLGAQ